MLNAANLPLALCPLLTDGAIEALLTAGTDEQKNAYVPKLISGEWTSTMNLTEPQAGSDLALVRTRAEPQGDGTYRVFGTKIFITWGEHDMAKNIVHLVLARTPDAPEGVKGISLFIVPKFLVNEDGSLGERNDVHCVSIEHKLGIKASPTAVLQFGDHGGAIGHLIGEENRGLEYMFIMMNAARFGVGMQGIGVADRAYQNGRCVCERPRAKPSGGWRRAKQSVAIIRHPDVRRTLTTMRALTEGARALAYVAAAYSDIAHRHADAAVRAEHQAIYEYLVPVVKGWSTEISIEVASMGVQVHGGMGFIEETGAAQYYRDARILTIYKGTTAIQANDLIGRKTLRDHGEVAKLILARIDLTLAELHACTSFSSSPAFPVLHRRLAAGRAALASVVDFVLANAKSDPDAVFAGGVPYLKLTGIVLAGWQFARAMLVAAAKHCNEGLAGCRPLPLTRDGADRSSAPLRFVPTIETYMPPNGFCTVNLLVTEVTPGTPFAMSATLATCEASVTVPFSVTAPSFATTLIFPALISFCFTIAPYTCLRSARLAFLPVAGAAEPGAAIAGALAGSLVWDHALSDTAMIATPTASVHA